MEQKTQPEPPFPPQHLTEPGLESRMQPRPKYIGDDYRAAGKLTDKVALITGGDSGIGRSIAVLFAREGADVALVYLAEEQGDAEETQQVVNQQGRRALLLPGDVCDPEFCKQAVEETVKEFGKLDILVNNAAYQKHRDSIHDISFEQLDRTFKTNIYAYFLMAKFATAHMKSGAAIINTGSETGLQGNGELLDYSATKGAIHAFTKSLAQSLVDKRIRVNCVAPGPVWTPLNPAERPDEDMEDFGEGNPLGRPAQPEEIAPAYVFFASNADSCYVTGHVLSLMGGETTAG